MQIERNSSQGIATARTEIVPSATTTSTTTGTQAGDRAATAAPLSGGSRTVSVGIFNEAETDTADTLSITSFGDMVAARTSTFAKKLMTALESSKIPTDEPIGLHLDASGNVSASGPYKDRVEKMFKENPELAKELKDIAALNALVALNEAMKRFARARKEAGNDEDQRKAAESTYTADCLTIQSRSNTLVLDKGQLTSAALDYMSSPAR